MVFYCMNTSFVYSFEFGLFPFSSNYHQCCCEHSYTVISCTHASVSPGTWPRSQIIGFQSMFLFLDKITASSFLKCCTNVHSYQQYTRLSYYDAQVLQTQSWGVTWHRFFSHWAHGQIRMGMTHWYDGRLSRKLHDKSKCHMQSTVFINFPTFVIPHKEVM